MFNTIQNTLITLLFLSTSFLTKGYSQEVNVLKIDDLQKIIDTKNDKTHIVNFWATWCRPCVKELPAFEQINNSTNVQVHLVSLDFIKDIDSKLKPFVIEKDLRSLVYLLDEVDYNSWIDQVDSNWSGSIPATLIVNNKIGFRKFIEKELTLTELETILQTIK